MTDTQMKFIHKLVKVDSSRSKHFMVKIDYQLECYVMFK